MTVATICVFYKINGSKTQRETIVSCHISGLTFPLIEEAREGQFGVSKDSLGARSIT